jgi:hypothetical protein
MSQIIKKESPREATCIESVKHMDYLVACKLGLQMSSRTSMYNLETLRATAMCSAQTLEHTDACHGVTPNWVIFHARDAELSVNTFPAFRFLVPRKFN